MIETHNLTKYFESFKAVEAVNLHVRAGEVLALLGPNGAGKTTTVRMLTAILKPTSGAATVAGYDVASQADLVRANVGILTEGHGLYLRQAGFEYLDFFGKLYGLDADRRRYQIETLASRFGLHDAVHRRIGEYSKGMRQKLALMRAMIHNPPVLLLDEPTSAMDPHSARQVRNAIKDLRGDGRAIILTTHNLNEAEEIADRIAIIRRGVIIANGTPLELKSSLLGPPMMEVRFADAINGAGAHLGGLAELDSSGQNWLRYRVDDPSNTNPQIVSRLTEHGARVITLSAVEQSLEEVYLRVVGDGEPEKDGA